MAIIPQELVMCIGTLLSNLDNFDERSHEKLWDVLIKCLLGPALRSNPDGHNAKVESLVYSFVGRSHRRLGIVHQRCRPETLSDHAIFTIAHRLETIIDSSEYYTPISF